PVGEVGRSRQPPDPPRTPRRGILPAGERHPAPPGAPRAAPAPPPAARQPCPCPGCAAGPLFGGGGPPRRAITRPRGAWEVVALDAAPWFVSPPRSAQRRPASESVSCPSSGRGPSLLAAGSSLLPGRRSLSSGLLPLAAPDQVMVRVEGQEVPHERG